eukprot:14820559-Alexandrium_andersonii.AAC.1
MKRAADEVVKPAEPCLRARHRRLPAGGSGGRRARYRRAGDITSGGSGALVRAGERPCPVGPLIEVVSD